MSAQALRYRPTGEGTPQPRQLETIDEAYRRRWVPVSEALPPERTPVLVIMRGDNAPAYAWMKFGGGEPECPYFVCPQGAAMNSRGCHISHPAHAQRRHDITHWYSPGDMPRLPPSGYTDAEWGLDACGWETRDQPLNPPDPEHD